MRGRPYARQYNPVAFHEPPLPSDFVPGVRPNQSRVTKRIYEVLGVQGTKIPRDLQGTFNVDGHEVVVYPSGGSPRRGSRGRGGRPHRIYIRVGARLVPATRVFQALKIGYRAPRVPSWRKP